MTLITGPLFFLLPTNLLERDNEMPWQGCQYSSQSADRRLEEENEPGKQLLATRKRRELLDLLSLDQTTFHKTGLELDRRHFFGEVVQGLGKGHRIVLAVGHRSRAREMLLQDFKG